MKYTEILPDAVCEEETWNRFEKLCEEHPEYLTQFLEAIDKLFKEVLL